MDWYPWGEEAIRKARELDRPIFLSIGYSACHWCHVMEHESFEDPEIAAILNEHFVSIKVDREERPDLDQIYMTAVQILTRQGGWPMSVFLTPELKPFYGGTYFPPDDRYGRPGFRRVLAGGARRLEDASAQELEEQAGEPDPAPASSRCDWSRPRATLDRELLHDAGRHAAARLRSAARRLRPGRPSFRTRWSCGCCCASGSASATTTPWPWFAHTLDHMAMGGMYDQLGGGFHRYSTDASWLVPHFEKMLYDNALLAVAYLEAFQATASRSIARSSRRRSTTSAAR